MALYYKEAESLLDQLEQSIIDKAEELITEIRVYARGHNYLDIDKKLDSAIRKLKE